MQEESSPEKLASRGDYFAEVGDMSRAEQYFVAALRSSGDAARLVRRLIAVCVADSRYPVALKYAEEHLRKHPSDIEVRYAAATLHIATGDDRRARQELAIVLSKAPLSGDAHFLLALLDKADGNVIAADAQFQAYLAASPAGEYAEISRANLMRIIE